MAILVLAALPLALSAAPAAEPRKILAELSRAIASHGLTGPEKARAYQERGILLDGMNRFEEAIRDYGEALRLNSNSAVALSNRADDYRRLNLLAAARRDYLTALAVSNPAPENAWYGLGQIAESEGKPAEAMDFYASAVGANPGYRPAANRLLALRIKSAVAQLNAAPPATVKTASNTPPATPAAEPAPASVAKTDAAPPPIVKAANSAPMTPVARPEPPPPATVKTLIRAPVTPATKSAQKPPPPTALARAAKPAPGVSAVADHSGTQEVQLASWQGEAPASQVWKKLLAKADPVLSGYSPHTVTADLPGKGHYTRLRVSARDGRQLCEALKAKGMACMAMAPAKAKPPLQVAARKSAG